MDEGKGNGNFIDKIKKMKKIKMIITIGGPVVIGLFFAMVLIIVIIAKWEWLLSVFSSSSTVGVQTIYDDTYLMDQINSSMENWTDEEKFVFVEMQRQRDIWINDYTDFNIKQSTVVNASSNELDLVKFVVPIQHRGAANITAYGYDYSSTNEVIGEDGTNLNDYNGEVTVYNRDTRDFYVQAGEKLGSTFFLFPGLRQMMGNSIAARISYDAVHPAYDYCSDGSGYFCLVNLGAILSDWRDLGTMYMNGEAGYHEYFDDYTMMGPAKAVDYFVNAINYGYDNCKINKPEDENDWNYINICNDYSLIYNENGPYVKDYNDYYSSGRLEESINEIISNRLEGGYAELPVYEYDENGGLTNTNIALRIPPSELDKETSRWFITTNTKRENDWNLYEEFLKKVYIPHLYINCKNCNPERTVEGILSEMDQLEKTYRYYNREEYIGGMSGGNYETAGAKHITSTDGGYTCNGVSIGLSADYAGHRANDLYSGETPTVFPLMEGTVVKINTGCNSLCPKSDANRYIAGVSLYSLSPACYCGGGWGNYVRIASNYNGRTIYATYAHLSSVAVSEGQNITFATPLGIMGTTGVSTGKHLHIELNYTTDSGNKFPATKIFSTKSVLSTICGGNAPETESGDKNEQS